MSDRVVIVCPFYFCTDAKRGDVTRRLFRHYAMLPESVTFLGIGSEGDVSREMFTEWHAESEYREYRQTWDRPVPASGSRELRWKFNAGVEAAREYDPDFVYVVGSDDFFPLEYFIARDADLTGSARGVGSGAYFWEYGDRNCAHWWDGESVHWPDSIFGCGCSGMSRRFLERTNWLPYQLNGDEYGLETYALEQGDLKLEAVAGLPGWHPKTDVALNTMFTISRAHILHTIYGQPFEDFLAYWDALG